MKPLFREKDNENSARFLLSLNISAFNCWILLSTFYGIQQSPESHLVELTNFDNPIVSFK